jgi:hypothetical protein
LQCILLLARFLHGVRAPEWRDASQVAWRQWTISKSGQEVAMKNRSRWYVASLLGALLMASSLAHADGIVPGIGGFYGGAGAIYTEFDDVGHDSRFGYRVYGGFGLVRLPAVFRVTLEGGYTQTGTFETEALGTGRVNNGDVGLQATLTTIPLIDLHGRAGYEWGDTSGMHYALGASLRIVPLLRLRGEYQIRNDFNAGMLGLELRIP